MDTAIVYIDSSIFISKNYHFEGSEFQSLIRWVKEDKVSVVITEVTLQEVRSHIIEDTEKAIQLIQKTRKQAKVLRNFEGMPLSTIFSDIDQKSYQESLLSKFDSFIKNCEIKIIKNSKADTDNIFQLYFEKKPPFGAGKKKCEFPDAFILDALNQVAEDSSEKIYVISQDKDFSEGVKEFKNLIYLSSVEEFLNKVVTHYELLAPLVTQFLTENIDKSIHKIENEFVNLGFYLSDQEGDVDDINVLEIIDLELYLIDINDGYAVFEITGVVSYSANVTYDDLETASYDSEDKILIPWRKIDAVVDREESVEVEVVVTFSHQEPYNFKIEELQITSPKNDVGVYANEDDWY